MIDTWRGTIVDEASWRVRMGDVVRAAAARLDARALAAVVALVVGTLAWDRLHFIGPAGEWPFADIPAEFWWSVVLVEVSLAAFLVIGVLLADASVERGARPAAAYTVAVVIAMALGSWLQYHLRQWTGMRVWADMPPQPHEIALAQPLYVFLEACLRNALVVAVYVNHRTTVRARERMHAAELARALAARRTYESRLQALQARVEPQFLFNTLGEVGRLFATAPADGTAMLDDLIAYLRAALPHLRESTSTVGQELDLAHAWLRIMRARAGARAVVDMDVDADVRGAALPPMVLLPLIGCAFGGTQTSGGQPLRVITRTDAGRLRIAVHDAEARAVPARSSDAWQALEQRLRVLYGDAATLTLEWREDRGTCAELAIPHEAADRHRR